MWTARTWTWTFSCKRQSSTLDNYFDVYGRYWVRSTSTYYELHNLLSQKSPFWISGLKSILSLIDSRSPDSTDELIDFLVNFLLQNNSEIRKFGLRHSYRAPYALEIQVETPHAMAHYAIADYGSPNSWIYLQSNLEYRKAEKFIFNSS